MRLIALIAGVAVAAAAFVSPSVAAADAGGTCVWNGFFYDCTTTITAPGSDGGSTTTSAPGGFTSGSTTCTLDGKTVPCSTSAGWFSDTGQCSGYVELASPQADPPAGDEAGAGAWYQCTLACAVVPTVAGSCADDFTALTFWSDEPPAGITTYTPAQAAAALARTFTLTPISIGMAPADKIHIDDPAGTTPYRRTWVGVPVWLWVADPTSTTYGPYQRTATLGGVTVTATAHVTSITWSTLDGETTTCGQGTPFDESAAANQLAADSPTCGFRFTHTSSDQPGETWPVTATSHWTVTWTGGGQTGTLALSNLTATANIRVGELQSVNTAVSAATIDGQS